jgi:hypothetical protein
VSVSSIPEADLSAIRQAELDLQALTCELPDDPDESGGEANYPAALARALLRRVQRQCATRNIPFGYFTDTAAEFGPQQLASWDAEVSRLEASYRIHVVA